MAPHCNEAIKAKMVTLLELGKTKAEVAASLGVSIPTIKRWKKRWLAQSQAEKDAFKMPKRKVGSGRPESISAGDMAKMRRKIHDNPRITAKKLKAALPGLSDRPVRTIQDWCNRRLSLPARKPAKKPQLTPVMQTSRI